MTDAKEKPLLSLGLVAYNQERFVEEAIAGAFSQTYSPLEIILSDDFSRDATFAIMQRMTAQYRGPHRIVLNRNEPNLGLARHINRLFDLAQGSLLVTAAADDVSLPNRVLANYEAWEKSNRKAACIYSGYHVIGPGSEPLYGSGMEFHYRHSGNLVAEKVSAADFFTHAKPRIFGCAAAYRPDVMEVFGPLGSTVVHEDDVLGFRAAFLGSLLRIECPLVNYRLHGTNAFGHSDGVALTTEEVSREEARSQRELETRYGMYQAFRQDLEVAHAKSLISPVDFERTFKVCQRKVNIVRGQIEFHRSSLFRRCTLLVALKRQGLPGREVRRMATRLLPSAVLYLLKSCQNRLRLLANAHRSSTESAGGIEPSGGG
jgi:glycosyltransferase involved in cell wall biosynthesis